MYGINDNFGDNGHVIPMLIRKCIKGNANLWGEGMAFREFLHSDDFAECSVMLMEKHNYEDLIDGVINVGSGDEISVMALWEIIAKITGMKGGPIGDYHKPFGVPRKIIDSTRIRKLGWKPKTSLGEGIRKTYEFFKNSTSNKPS